VIPQQGSPRHARNPYHIEAPQADHGAHHDDLHLGDAPSDNLRLFSPRMSLGIEPDSSQAWGHVSNGIRLLRIKVK
jgi:hypothetical protein